MFTRKTRVISALLTVWMLISMVASIAVPVSAVADGIDFGATKAEISKYNPDYFEASGHDAIEVILAVCNVALAEQEKAQPDEALLETYATRVQAEKAVLAEASLLINGVAIDEGNLKDVPEYRDYEIYKNYNTGNVWGISSKGDWDALAKAGADIAEYTIVLKNDVDMSGITVTPLCGGGSFAGKFLGFGHTVSHLYVKHGNGTSAVTYPGGVISKMKGGQISNVRFENCTIDADVDPAGSNINDYTGSVGFLSGDSVTSYAIFDRVYIAPTCTVKVVHKDEGSSFGGFVARSTYLRVTNSISMVKFDLDTQSNVGMFGAWDKNSSYIRNSYAVAHPGNVNATAYASVGSGDISGVEIINNVIMKGGAGLYNKSSVSITNSTFDSNDMAPEQVAYQLNANFVKSSGVERAWFCLTEDGQGITWGQELDKPVKVVVDANGDLFNFYGVYGQTITLDVGDDTAEFKMVSGKGSISGGNQFTFGSTDAKVKVTSLLTASLDNAVALYAGKDPSYFADPEAIALKLELVSEKTYLTQEAVNRDAKDLVELYVPAPGKAFPASYGVEGFAMGPIVFEGFGIEGNEEFPLVAINDLDDLLYVKAHSKEYAKSQTIVMKNDLDLKEAPFDFIEGLTAGFDGQGHTIKDHIVPVAGFFKEFNGPFIKNVTFDFTKTSTPVNRDIYESAVIANVVNHNGVIFENIAVKNANFKKSSGSTANGFALVLSKTAAGVTVNMKNITIENCAIATPSSKYHYGFLVGQHRYNGAVLNIDGVQVYGSTITGSGANKSYLVGDIETNSSTSAKTTTNIKNALIVGNKGAEAAFAGQFSSQYGENRHSLNVENAIVLGNNGLLARYFKTGYNSFKTQTLTGANIYTDNISMQLDGDKTADINDITESTYPGIVGFKNAVHTITTEKVVSGETVYAYNNTFKNVKGAKTLALVKKDWTDASGRTWNYLPAWADESHKALAKVTFGEEGPSFYTDADGKLMGDTSVLAGLTDCSFSVKDPANAVFNGDTKVDIYSHYVNTAVSHEDGKHTGVCEYCQKEFISPCTDGEGYPKNYSDKWIQSAWVHKCSFCENEWMTDIIMNSPTLYSEATFMVPVGETVTVPVSVVNNPGFAALEFTATFDSNVLSFKGVSFADKTCDIQISEDQGEVNVKVSNRNLNEVLSENGEGLLFNLEFEVKVGAAEGDTPIAVSFEAATDAAGNSADALRGFNATVKVHNKMLGDFDGDQTLSTADVTRMMQYMLGKLEEGTYHIEQGDMNLDSKVDLMDAVQLLQILSRS